MLAGWLIGYLHLKGERCFYHILLAGWLIGWLVDWLVGYLGGPD